MNFFDLPADELRTYAPAIEEPIEFDSFWRETLASSPPAAPELRRVPTYFPDIDVFDVTFAGYGGDPISGWLLIPSRRDSPLTTIVEFKGYGEGRGLPHERLHWVAAGYAHFIMDSRGQGSMWGSGGTTADPHGSGPASSGMLTRGIESPQGYYYRRLITDAANAVASVTLIDGVDVDRIVTAGSSQGGALAIAAAALAPHVTAVLADVPFLAHPARAVGLATAGPYPELGRYLAVHRDSAASVFSTLSYVDVANFAPRVQAPGIYSVALQDHTCPPSTVYAALNRMTAPKEIVEYAYNDHEGGGTAHWLKQIDWLSRLTRD